jgi:hypothetical protein
VIAAQFAVSYGGIEQDFGRKYFLYQGERNLEKEKLIALYMLWALVVIIEIWWLHSVTTRPNTAADLTYVVTVIGVTLVMGAVGLNLLSKPKE